jgi:hypothetical protein
MTFTWINSASKYRYLDHVQRIAKPHIIHHRGLHQSLPTLKEIKTSASSSTTPGQHDADTSFPSFSLFQQIREARPAVRYTVYAGLGLMATVETTFWLHVLRAKFFPRASDEERSEDDELLLRLRDAMKSYSYVWMRNYGRYYGAYVWGVGYGGLGGLDDEQQL